MKSRRVGCACRVEGCVHRREVKGTDRLAYSTPSHRLMSAPVSSRTTAIGEATELSAVQSTDVQVNHSQIRAVAKFDATDPVTTINGLCSMAQQAVAAQHQLLFDITSIHNIVTGCDLSCDEDLVGLNFSHIIASGQPMQLDGMFKQVRQTWDSLLT